jgi:hypothetical protein
MLNLTAAVLRLTKPFTSGYLQQSPKFTDLLSRHLSPAYFSSRGTARLGAGVAAEQSLSGERGMAAAAAAAAAGSSGSSGGSSSGSGVVIAADPAAAAASASFIAEAFFIAQRYMHVGLLPAVHRCVRVCLFVWAAACV